MARKAGFGGKLVGGMHDLLAQHKFVGVVADTPLSGGVVIKRPGQADPDGQAYAAAPGLTGTNTGLTALATAMTNQATHLHAAAGALRIAAAALSSPIFNTAADDLDAAAADATAAATAALAAGAAGGVSVGDRVLVVEASGTWNVVCKLVL